MIYPFIRRMVALHAHHTGKSLSDAYRSVVDAISGAKIAHPGDKPGCLLCGHPRALVTSTRRDGEITIRYHRCDLCGFAFQSIQSTDPADLPPVKITDPATTPVEKLIIDVEGPRKRSPRKRKR